MVNWIGLYTLTSREVGRFFSVYRQTVIPGLISSVLYILIFGIHFRTAHIGNSGSVLHYVYLAWSDNDEHFDKRVFQYFIINATNETLTTVTSTF